MDRIINTTLREKPEGATHWSTRSLAKKLGVSRSAVHRVLKAHKIQPHRERGFKLSKDPQFNEKVTDIVGLYIQSLGGTIPRKPVTTRLFFLRVLAILAPKRDTSR